MIPRRILNKFTATVNGKEVFSADFEPAVSANPYIQFKFKAVESGDLKLEWLDDDAAFGYRASAPVETMVTVVKAETAPPVEPVRG